MLPGNQEAIEAWNTILFEKFSRFRHLLVDALGVHGTRAMDRYPPRPGASVVDIGCGFGDTTVELARRVGPEGRAYGIDAASKFIEQARKDAHSIPNASFDVVDVEEKVPGGPYDMAFSRMGTMFFNSPVIALRNIRKACASGARLCMVVWRKKEANEGFYTAESIAREILGDPPKGDQITCGPGPFSMASPDLVSDQLIAAGWQEPTFLRNDAALKLGSDLDEAVQVATTIGPAGEVIRLAGEEGVRKRDQIVAEMRKAMTPFVRPDGVYGPSTTWVVTATAP